MPDLLSLITAPSRMLLDGLEAVAKTVAENARTGYSANDYSHATDEHDAPDWGRSHFAYPNTAATDWDERRAMQMEDRNRRVSEENIRQSEELTRANERTFGKYFGS